MKAAVVHEFGQPPVYGDVDEPTPADGEVIVEVTAAALYQRVRSEAAGRHYSSSQTLPLTAGFDGVGRDPSGRRVYFFAAHPGRGTMAQRVAVPPAKLMPIPDGVDDVHVAAVMNAALSSWLALRERARLQEGESVLVLGATGNAGTAAVSIASVLGASHVIGAGRNQEALARLPSLGATLAVSLAEDANEQARQIAEHAQDVDVVVDYLWGTVTQALLPALIRRRADKSRPLRWVQVGSLAGVDLQVSAAWLRQSNLQLSGSGTGAISDGAIFEQLTDLVARLPELNLTCKPIARPLADVSQAWSETIDSDARIVFQP